MNLSVVAERVKTNASVADAQVTTNAYVAATAQVILESSEGVDAEVRMHLSESAAVIMDSSEAAQGITSSSRSAQEVMNPSEVAPDMIDSVTKREVCAVVYTSEHSQ